MRRTAAIAGAALIAATTLTGCASEYDKCVEDVQALAVLDASFLSQLERKYQAGEIDEQEYIETIEKMEDRMTQAILDCKQYQ